MLELVKLLFEQETIKQENQVRSKSEGYDSQGSRS